MVMKKIRLDKKLGIWINMDEAYVLNFPGTARTITSGVISRPRTPGEKKPFAQFQKTYGNAEMQKQSRNADLKKKNREIHNSKTRMLLCLILFILTCQNNVICSGLLLLCCLWI